MAEQIIDGTGTGNRTKVDNGNRLHVHAVGETVAENSSITGNSYNVNTGTINLTTANESSLLYIKNNGDNDIHIVSIGYLLGASTNGTGELDLIVRKNPTAGTLITDQTPVAINQNKNAGSSSILTAQIYKGAEGKTATSGTDFYYSLQSSAGKAYVISTGNIVLPKGSSISVVVQPQAANTSMDVQIFLSVVEYTLDQ